MGILKTTYICPGTEEEECGAEIEIKFQGVHLIHAGKIEVVCDKCRRIQPLDFNRG